MALKAAILGTGAMGKKHASSLLKLGITVSAVCNHNRIKAEEFKKDLELHDAAVYDDFTAMIENSDFDVLFICIPPYAHTGQFELAAGRGKHIFIEKPIAIRTSIGARMVNSAKKNKIITMTGFHMRKGAAVKRLAELVKRGAAGKPVLCNTLFQCNITDKPWWINNDLCGGQILEQAIHIYDLCRLFLGEPKSAQALMANICHSHLPGYTIEDASACLAGFWNGAMASISANNCAVPGNGVLKLTAVFEKITADFTDHNHGVIVFTSGPQTRTEKIDGDTDAHFEMVREFIECVDGRRETSCDILEGYRSLCFVETAVRSAGLDGAKLAVDQAL